MKKLLLSLSMAAVILAVPAFMNFNIDSACKTAYAAQKVRHVWGCDYCGRIFYTVSDMPPGFFGEAVPICHDSGNGRHQWHYYGKE